MRRILEQTIISTTDNTLFDYITCTVMERDIAQFATVAVIPYNLFTLTTNIHMS